MTDADRQELVEYWLASAYGAGKELLSAEFDARAKAFRVSVDMTPARAKQAMGSSLAFMRFVEVNRNQLYFRLGDEGEQIPGGDSMMLGSADADRSPAATVAYEGGRVVITLLRRRFGMGRFCGRMFRGLRGEDSVPIEPGQAVVHEVGHAEFLFRFLKKSKAEQEVEFKRGFKRMNDDAALQAENEWWQFGETPRQRATHDLPMTCCSSCKRK